MPRWASPLAAELPAAADVVVDFSVPAAAEALIETCRRRRLPLVVATTGLGGRNSTPCGAAAKEIPLVWSPNMSLAVNLTMKLCETAAKALADKDVDVEILERHHRFKEDAPSGTALRSSARSSPARWGRRTIVTAAKGRPGKRPHEEIGYHAIRVGDDPGQHTIVFGMLGETIELSVRATNRDCYALGALAAAKFLAGKAPGLYGMNDVLGSETPPRPGAMDHDRFAHRGWHDAVATASGGKT